jgi:hypothetical protein
LALPLIFLGRPPFFPFSLELLAFFSLTYAPIIVAGLISFLQCGHSNFIEKSCLNAFLAGGYLFEKSHSEYRVTFVELVPTSGPVVIVLSEIMDLLTHMCRV